MTAAGPDETLTMAPPPDAPLRIKRPRLAGLIIGGVALAGLIAFVLHVGDIADFAQRAAEADWRWLALGVVAQAFAFLAQALVFALALARRGNRVRRLSLFSLSIGKLFADQAIPSIGVSGAVFLVHALTRRGVSAADAFTAFAFGAASSIAGFLIFAAGAVAFMTLGGGAFEAISVDRSDLHYVAIIGALLLFVTAALLLVSSGRTPIRPAALRRGAQTGAEALRQIVVDKGLFAQCLALQAVARLLDCVTLLAVFAAIGEPVSFLSCIVAISLAALAATLAPTPMGLGSFEAGLLAALSGLGVGVEAALAATLIYRGLSLGLPLALGFLVVQRELLKR